MSLDFSSLRQCEAPFNRRGCKWFTDDPARLCEEHKNCSSCGNPTREGCLAECLGPQLYECECCKHHFYAHELHRVGTASLCRKCRS